MNSFLYYVTYKKRLVTIIILNSLFSFTCLSQTLTQQEWRDSLHNLSAMIEQRPDDLSLRMKKAAVNIELEQWQYALNEYNRVLDKMPQNLTALYYRAFVYQKTNQYGFARRDYEKLLLVEPQNKHALMGLALTNMSDKHFTDAYDNVNRLVEMFPNDADVYAIRSEIEESLKMIDVAYDDINKAIELEESSMSWAKRTIVTIHDDMTTYQLKAFALLIKLKKKDKAKKCLDYLVMHGMPKAQLNDYYNQITRKKDPRNTQIINIPRKNSKKKL